MSRSYKKVYAFTDSNPYFKNQAARKVRNLPLHAEVADGAAYKRLYQSYNICDFKFLLYHEHELLTKPSGAPWYTVAERKAYWARSKRK
jgi:hypothetical protein